MERYYQSHSIDNEAERLRLIGLTANESSRGALKQLAVNGFGPTRILDAGCGTGDAFAVLAEVFPSAEIIGVDQSDKAIEKAKQKGVATDVFVGNLLSLSGLQNLKSKTPFDLVFVRNTLLHVSDVSRAIGELKYLTSPGGIIVAQEPDWDKANANWDDFTLFKEAMMKAMSSHGINPVMGQDIESLFEKSGLTDVKTKTYEFKTMASDEGWKVLEHLLEVSRGLVEQTLQEAGVTSVDEMAEKIKTAQKYPENYFYTPAWVVVTGVKTDD